MTTFLMPYPPQYAAGLPARSGGGDFAQGFVTAGCLSAFQDRPSPSSPAELKRVLRHALQGGTALAAGRQVAIAAQQGDYAGALAVAAAGAAGVLLIERLLRDQARTDKE